MPLRFQCVAGGDRAQVCRKDKMRRYAQDAGVTKRGVTPLDAAPLQWSFSCSKPGRTCHHCHVTLAVKRVSASFRQARACDPYTKCPSNRKESFFSTDVRSCPQMLVVLKESRPSKSILVGWCEFKFVQGCLLYEGAHPILEPFFEVYLRHDRALVTMSTFRSF